MREVTIQRDTKETKIRLSLNLDGKGIGNCDTKIGFFDHMLEGFARHGLFDLTVKVEGDLEVDSHHTIEDTGIVLGEAIKKAVGDKSGIVRYGHAILPMDEALLMCAIDLSGRPYLVHEVNYSVERLGSFDTEMAREFFYAVSYSGAMNLHLRQFSGSNNHHIMEASFKAFAKALSMAVRKDERIEGILSTKGSL
ncbi:MAG TPA: imidazoleglycerol-phosphate dehydratase HisB [Lachnospiraceae bacterium]